MTHTSRKHYNTTYPLQCIPHNEQESQLLCSVIVAAIFSKSTFNRNAESTPLAILAIR